VIPRAVVASKNPDKIVEIAELLAGVVGELVTDLVWDDVVEDADTLAGNAILKAAAVFAATGLPSIGDDTGLFVKALDSRPGVHTARYAGPEASYEDNVTKMLTELAGRSDRQAEFRTAVAYVDADRQIVVEGVLRGRISEERRGSGGFGYDPIFEVDSVTLSEMGRTEKQRLSHRARAIRALRTELA
jgi:XTP/dITP diphosphohydrolase